MLPSLVNKCLTKAHCINVSKLVIFHKKPLNTNFKSTHLRHEKMIIDMRKFSLILTPFLVLCQIIALYDFRSEYDLGGRYREIFVMRNHSSETCHLKRLPYGNKFWIGLHLRTGFERMKLSPAGPWSLNFKTDS